MLHCPSGVGVLFLKVESETHRGRWPVRGQLHCYIFNHLAWSCGQSIHLLFLVSGLGVIPLKHYGKREVLSKIANMEPEYDTLMHFNHNLLPQSAVASGCQGLWDYGIEVTGKVKKYSTQTPTLEAGMYGFKGGEELLTIKGYLYAHGKYQLVLLSNLVQFSCRVLKDALSNQWLTGHVVVFLP